MKTSRIAAKDKRAPSTNVEALALCLMHLEEETRREGLEFTAQLIKAAAESLTYPDQKITSSVKG